ncbi:hypothetical protein C0J52_06363 [Blattella germanica]|nr:hypothetical protein C0J52_06363 [Blattella germanica]
MVILNCIFYPMHSINTLPTLFKCPLLPLVPGHLTRASINEHALRKQVLFPLTNARFHLYLQVMYNLITNQYDTHLNHIY